MEVNLNSKVFVMNIEFSSWSYALSSELKTLELEISRSMLDIHLSLIYNSTNQSDVCRIPNSQSEARTFEILRVILLENSHWSESSRDFQKEGEKAK